MKVGLAPSLRLKVAAMLYCEDVRVQMCASRVALHAQHLQPPVVAYETKTLVHFQPPAARFYCLNGRAALHRQQEAILHAFSSTHQIHCTN